MKYARITPQISETRPLVTKDSNSLKSCAAFTSISILIVRGLAEAVVTYCCPVVQKNINIYMGVYGHPAPVEM